MYKSFNAKDFDKKGKKGFKRSRSKRLWGKLSARIEQTSINKLKVFFSTNKLFKYVFCCFTRGTAVKKHTEKILKV
jgi:hypothetical protein